MGILSPLSIFRMYPHHLLGRQESERPGLGKKKADKDEEDEEDKKRELC
jgi:hypothetical protein